MNMVTTINSKNHLVIHDLLKSGTFEWHLEPHAQLTIIHILENDAPLVANLKFALGKASRLNYHPIIMGGSRSELNLCVTLQDLAQLEIAGAYALTRTHQCSFTTRQEHQGSSASSTLVINGVAADDASIQYQGGIVIQKNAPQSIAKQENKTLLIGSRAKAISIPSLEVQTNDVQCAHGSAVGPLQEDQLIYAQSRGFSLEHARKLLITSFFAQALSGMLDESMREKIVAQLVNKVLANTLS